MISPDDLFAYLVATAVGIFLIVLVFYGARELFK